LRMLSWSPNTDSRSWLEWKNIHTINKVVPTYQLAYYWPYHPRTSKKYLTCLGYVIPDVPTHGHLPICLFEGRNLHLLGGLEYGREGNWNKSMTLPVVRVLSWRKVCKNRKKPQTNMWLARIG
jgi:hypothetical protein